MIDSPAAPAEREPSLPDPTAPLTASGNLRRRAAVSRSIEIGARASALGAVALLGGVVYTVIQKGAPALSWRFLTTSSPGADGGIANAILGTAVLVAFAALLAVPIGVLTGLYLTEFAGPNSRSAQVLKLVLDLLQGLPTIIAGIVVYGLLVTAFHQQTGLAGSVALAVVMLPLTARASQEVLLLVPGTLREAADSLGVDRWRTVLGVIVPAAAGGIATGALLSVARAAGETAPLLIVNSIYNPISIELNPFGHGVPSIPMYIWTTFDLPAPAAVTAAWGAALVLLAGILIVNVFARLLLARSRAKMRA